MQTYWIAMLALLFLHIGFGALFGLWLYRVKNQTPLRIMTALAITGEVLLIFSIGATPLGALSKILIFIFASLAMLITFFRFDAIDLNKDWLWIYIALTMGLILIWSINQAQAILAFSMSLLASVACLLAVIRGKQILLK